MPDVTWGIKVSRIQGEASRKVLVELGVFDRGHKIFSDESHIYLPTQEIDEQTKIELGSITQFEIVKVEFEKEERAQNLEELLSFRPSFEVVGDIAIVEDREAEKVAFALLSTNRSIRTVIVPISDVEGEFRTRRFRHVAGEQRTITIHKEHGLRYRVDLEGAYFTPHLGTERLRIALQVNEGDLVLDMFAGVGPFSLLMAKKGARIISIEKNPIAVQFLRENAKINKIKDIEILEGDAMDLALPFQNLADHVIMNLPHSSSLFLIPAIRAAKPGGIVHYYCIAPEDDLYMDLALIEKAAEQLGASVEVLYRDIVRSYAPRRHNVVIDFRVIKSA